MKRAKDIPEAIHWHEGMLLAPQHFQQFAARRGQGIFAVIDATLRELPGWFFNVITLGDQNQAGIIKQGHCHARPIVVSWNLFLRPIQFRRFAIAETGAKAMPRLSTVAAHLATRSRVTG